MTKKEHEAALKSIKHLHTNKLKQAITTIDSWSCNHEKKKSCWFWGDNGNASQRRQKEKYYSCDEDLKLGTLVINYWSNCNMSRQHVYWDDGLIINKEANFNFGDLQKIKIAIEDILAKREK